MTTKAMAVAMAAGLLGCATAGRPRGEGSRSASWRQDRDIEELVEEISQTLDCRPGSQDPSAFLCPMEGLRIEPFAPPAHTQPLLGIQLVIREAVPGLDVALEHDRLAVLQAGPHQKITMIPVAHNAAEHAWDAAVYDALLARLAGRPAPFAPPPWVEPLLGLRLPDDDGSRSWTWDSLPERFFRVHDPLRGEAILEIAPVSPRRFGVTIFPLLAPLTGPERAAQLQLAKSLLAAFDARRAASAMDETKPPISPDALLRLRTDLLGKDACGPSSAFPDLCAVSSVTLAGAPLPRRNGVYVGLLYEVGANGAGRLQMQPVDTDSLTLLEVGPSLFRSPILLLPENLDEQRAIQAAAGELSAHLSGRARGALAASPSLLDEVASISHLPPPPGAPFEHTSARLYAGRVPGGDEVYVVVAPRKGGGALIGLYPQVPWYPAPAQTAAR